MRKSQFIKHINALGEADLREELNMLFTKLDEVKKFYTMELGSAADRQRKYDAAKSDIKAKFATKGIRKPRRPRIQKVKQILSATEKLAVFNFEMIDLYLYTTESALKFMGKYNYLSTPLFNIINNSFDRAVDLIIENKMAVDYEERCRKILGNARISRDIHSGIKASFNRIYA
jgi:hypothetical protein